MSAIHSGALNFSSGSGGILSGHRSLLCFASGDSNDTGLRINLHRWGGGVSDQFWQIDAEGGGKVVVGLDGAEHVVDVTARFGDDFAKGCLAGADAKDAGFWSHGAAMDGAESWDAVDWTGPVVLVMGSEGKGLRPRVASECDRLVALPLVGRIESLNVATATAALLYEAVRQRQA